MGLTVPVSDADLGLKLAVGRSLTFGDRANRDRAAKIAGPTWRKSSTRNQLLDDHYVDDAADQTDRGLGNVKSWWSTLYFLNPPGGQRW